MRNDGILCRPRPEGVLIVIRRRFSFRSAIFVAFTFSLFPIHVPAQQKQADAGAGNRIVLGRLSNGADVAFVRAGSGDWGIVMSGNSAPEITQQKPAQIEIYRGDDNVSDLAAGYQQVRKQSGEVVATAKVAGKGSA